MNTTRRLSLAALVVACLHLVFGAIVRISGSGMGCGDHWPKCYGYWFPPFNRPDLIIEVSHRYLASILTFTVLSMAFVAWRNRKVTGGAGGPMRSAFGAVGAVLSAAILGGVTVKMGNAPWATVAHWLVAMTLLAMVATTAIRTGALGGASSLVQRGSDKARRSALIAAVLAIFAVALGGLTAKYPGAAVGCTTVPFCGPNPAVERAGVHVQITHRTLAVLLVLHLIGMVMMLRKRRAEEAPVVVRAANIALAMVLLQLVVASSMVLFHLPPVLRSLHEATGVGIWLSCFALAYLARRSSKVEPSSPAVTSSPDPVLPPVVPPAPVTPSVVRKEEPVIAPAPTPVFEAASVVEDVAEDEVEDDVEIRDVFEAEELDWEPKRSAAADEELDEFSLLALEVEEKAEAGETAGSLLTAEGDAADEADETAQAVEAVHADVEEPAAESMPVVEAATVVERSHSERSEESVVIAAAVELPAETVDPSVALASLELTRDDIEGVASLELTRDDIEAEPAPAAPVGEVVAGESSVVAPPVEAPKLSPLPVPTMAVLVARGADLL